MSKVILTDVDGVVLDWFSVFKEWVKDEFGLEPVDYSHHSISKLYNLEPGRGSRLIHLFNRRPKMSDLPPYLDAVTYVQELHNEGWRFIAVTALGNDETIQSRRIENLDRVFGEGVFERVIFTSRDENKENALKPYEGSGYVWIENKSENAVVGHNLGLNTFIMNQPHNQDVSESAITRVNNWSEIFVEVLKSSIK